MDFFAKYLTYLLIVFIYWLPFILVGLIIFALSYGVVNLIALLYSPRASGPTEKIRGEPRRKIRRQGFWISIVLAALLSVPCVIFYINYSEKDKHNKRLIESAPHEEAIRNFRQQLQPDEYWTAGTITVLEKWINNQDTKFQDEMNRELRFYISDHISRNKLVTDKVDNVAINRIAEMPNPSDHPDKIIANARAYLRYIDNGLGDLWSTKLFEKIPGKLTTADQLDYVTYLGLAMTYCTVQPDSNCRTVMAKEKLDEFELESIYADYMKEIIPPLRKALGYEAVTGKNRCCGYQLPVKNN